MGPRHKCLANLFGDAMLTPPVALALFAWRIVSFNEATPDQDCYRYEKCGRTLIQSIGLNRVWSPA